jgi:hypothetical protein
MDEDGNVELQALLDRLRQGDREARRLLLERACERLRRRAAQMLPGSACGRSSTRRSPP